MPEHIKRAGKWTLRHIPSSVRVWKLSLNFILVHYIYLIFLGLAGSIILYGSGSIPYIDAIFFGVASATQSGLNVIDLNEMKLYQQITMFMVANITNPIFINTAVVFVRLYWFEKRFQHIVKDIREHRRSKGKSHIIRTKSGLKEAPDLERLASGVNGREIRVLHETTQPNGMSGTTARVQKQADKFKEKMGLDGDAQSVEPTPEGSNKSGGDEEALSEKDMQDELKDSTAPDVPVSPVSDHHLGLNSRLRRDIMFADEVKQQDHAEGTPELDNPEQADVSKHIAFIQKQQRNAREGSAIRIPGPRGFERGEMPRSLDGADDSALHRPQTRNTLHPIQSERDREGLNTQGTDEMNLDDHPERGGIKWNEQEHPGHFKAEETFDRTATFNSRFGLDRIRSGVGSVLRNRRSNTNDNLHMNHGKSSIGRTFTNLTTIRSREHGADPMPYLSWQATTGRNSQFLGLTEEQREELGGIEYRSLKLLAKILLCYYIGFHLFGMVVNLPWIKLTKRWRNVVIEDGVDPGWWAVFTSASLFNDLGLTLNPDSMLSFSRATLLLTVGSFLIIIGNTGFPIMLRFIIWVTSKLVPYGSGTWEELKFLLDHPRRCFTLLFPSKATWWLCGILVGLNLIDVIFFIILDLDDPAVLALPPGFRILDAWFQAASTRTAGFAVINLYHLHPAIQVSYMVMMYISVLPIAISVRKTNVYEEKSLGIFGGDEEGSGDEKEQSYVGQHLRRQLSFDLWYIFLGFFIICIVEGNRLSNVNDHAFTMFSVLFEIVSAYGTVGLSLGYPTINASFSAEFRVISKLVICAMMLRGRHRGLPYALDRAILLPSEHMQKKEAEEADRRAGRRNSMFAEGSDFGGPRHGTTFSQSDIDTNGLPKQHLPRVNSSRDGGSMVGAVGDHSPERTRTVRRMPSRMSNNSGRPAHSRNRSLSRVIAGALSAGPTLPKHD
ncbi:low affinity potassium transporter [Vermiconidia calcicola]|uniref:Low affinity potassium transporter n=1 Tax=Vermiconidia calcicola TaxID=1690605 RepID=A0ACC3MKZ2_9PEZI|nr:low affinity potassium transporter [Vermiconidia calcicola]